MKVQRRSGSQPTLVALHGFAGTGADWRPVLEPLPNALVLPDLPGHGGTSGPLPEGFEALADALAELPVEGPAVWLGYSFGARCLWQLALRHPERVHALVLVSPHPGLGRLADRVQRRRQDEDDARLLETQGLDAFLEAWHARPVFETRRAKPAWAQEVEAKRATNDPKRLAEVLRRFGLGAQPDVRPRLAEITAPTLWVTGALDEPYTALARDCAGRLPRGEHAVLAGAGHGAHLEEPQAFQDVLRRFLGRREPATDRRNP